MKNQYAIIAFILFIIFAISACVPPPPTAVPTQSIPISDTVSLPEPTPTPLPPPLVEIFPQAGDGVEFIFPDNQPNLISKQFIENGNCVHSGTYGFQLTYNFIEGGSGGWGVHWVVPPLTHFTATGFTTLTFWVKGISGSETFKIGLKDTGRVDVRDDEKEITVDSLRYVLVSDSEWRQVNIPLNHFADNNGAINLASIENVSFDFDQSKGSGSICLDDIAFK